MSKSDPSEEKYPLLLLFLEDGQRPNKYKRVAFDQNRYKGITSGASAVITKWPGHLATCWLTSVLIGLILLLTAMMIFAFSLRPTVHFLTARCKGQHRNNHVENYNAEVVHLIHTCNPWTEKQLDFLELIAQNYNQLTIDLIIVHNETNYSVNHALFLQEIEKKDIPNTSLKQNQTVNVQKPTTEMGKISKGDIIRKKRYLNPKKLRFIINIGAQNILKLLLDKRSLISDDLDSTETVKPVKKFKTIQKLLETFPNIKITHTTLRKYFKNTPLSWAWPHLHETTKLFAIRVLQMWNFGGITFNIPGEPIDSKFSRPTQTSDSLSLEKLVLKAQTYFSDLPEGLVTIDNGGFHMETKTVCHAFFGEMLVSLRKANKYALPEDIVTDVLKKFCRRGAVDAEYCQKFNSLKNF